MLNKIALDRDGKLYWNGQAVTPQTLDKYLALGTRLNPEPWIFLESEMGAPCASLEDIRNRIEKHANCADGYRCNEGVMTIWDKIPLPPGTPPS